jgi:hypothetical protein
MTTIATSSRPDVAAPQPRQAGNGLAIARVTVGAIVSVGFLDNLGIVEKVSPGRDSRLPKQSMTAFT